MDFGKALLESVAQCDKVEVEAESYGTWRGRAKALELLIATEESNCFTLRLNHDRLHYLSGKRYVHEQP